MPLPELYYFHDATCGIKVRLALFEKGVGFKPCIVDRYQLSAASYRALNPQAVVPTLVHAGAVLTESTVICLYVDDAFSGPALKPDRALYRAQMHAWLKAIDETYFFALSSLTFALAVCPDVLERYPEPQQQTEYLESILVTEKRRLRRSILAHGLDAPEVAKGVETMRQLLAHLDAALTVGPFVAGPTYSLADACLTPFILRLDALGLAPLWADRSRISRWWTEMRSRSSFQRLLDESFPATYFTAMRERVGDATAALRLT